jgi:two-component system chemotaxis response regulator CheY
MIVDDSATVCGVIERILRSCGFVEIEALHHGQAALDRMQAVPFDIVICDWETASVSGIDVLKARHEANSKDTHFILMSAKKDMEWVLAARKAGADGLITKPFTAAMLRQKIDQLSLAH